MTMSQMISYARAYLVSGRGMYWADKDDNQVMAGISTNYPGGWFMFKRDMGLR
jgi:hypothetical protein